MPPSRRFLLRLLGLLVTLLPLASFAAEDETAPEKTESPYFFVNSDDPALDQLPLKETRVDVRIIGVIADVTVTQRYKNEGSRPLEARYVFPGSTRAAVHAMQVRLADRLLRATIREKQQARVEFEAAKSEGKTAALLEQHRPNVFQMNVANILPGDDIYVELRYTELMVPTDGRYQFVYPTVVGPRYNGSPATGSGTREKWISTPHLRAGEPATSRLDLNVQLATPMPLQAVTSPSHQIQLQKLSDTETRVALGATDQNENNRDFVLEYQLAGDRITSGMLLSQGKNGGENFFLAMIEPPRAVPVTQIVPREYVFIVDISGSMHGFPLDTAKTLLSDLVGHLRPNDSFNVMLFSGSSRTLAPRSVPATHANIEQALQMLNQQMGSGGTELLPALRKALALPHDADRARTFVVVTDGYVNVEHETFELIRQNLASANLFAFGIGSGVNRHLIEGMARAGQGEPFVVLRPELATDEAKRFRQMIEAPVLTHVKARFEGFDTYDVEPISLPDVFARRPAVLFGKWRGEPKGRLVLEGRSANGPYRAALEVPRGQTAESNGALAYLWARHRISSLSDQETLDGKGSQRREILALGLKYHLLTAYTSFIAVDHVVRNPGGNGASVDQPLPLPQGVSNLAVGQPVPSTPEPGFWWLLSVSGLIMLFAFRKRSRAVKVMS